MLHLKKKIIESADSVTSFVDAFRKALSISHSVAFKSIVAYRSGLDVLVDVSHDNPGVQEDFERVKNIKPVRLGQKEKYLGSLVVGIAVQVAQEQNKPLQLHTGFGDADLLITKASSGYLQPLIAANPGTNFVLLHASYPFTREAGYLTSVFDNVYLDFGLVFPLVSRSGQREIMSQIFELSPTSKILFSTDAHHWPESYYLANLQGREALFEVLNNPELIDTDQAVEIAKDVLFRNSNRLYRLGLPEPEVHSIQFRCK